MTTDPINIRRFRRRPAWTRVVPGALTFLALIVVIGVPALLARGMDAAEALNVEALNVGICYEERAVTEWWAQKEISRDQQAWVRSPEGQPVEEFNGPDEPNGPFNADPPTLTHPQHGPTDTNTVIADPGRNDSMRYWRFRTWATVKYVKVEVPCPTTTTTTPDGSTTTQPPSSSTTEPPGSTTAPPNPSTTTLATTTTVPGTTSSTTTTLPATTTTTTTTTLPTSSTVPPEDDDDGGDEGDEDDTCPDEPRVGYYRDRNRDVWPCGEGG